MAPMKPFEELGRHIAENQRGLADVTPDHSRIRASLVAFTHAPKARRFGTSTAVGLAFGLAAAASIIAYFVRPSAHDLNCFIAGGKTPVAVGAWVSAVDGESLSLRFSDGTRATLLPESRGRVTRLSPFGADVVVEQGKAAFDVIHRVQGRWQVNSGPFVVQVTGTRFDVEWQPDKDHFVLNLYEGHVRVSGCALGDGQAVSAGQRLEAWCARREFAISRTDSMRALPDAQAMAQATPAPQTPIAAPSELPPTGPMRFATSPASSSQRPWLQLAHQSRFAAAYDAALALGFDAECRERGASDLLLLGDVARLSGHVERARQAYQAVRRRWPGSTEGALAAFLVGRAEFDQRADYASAVGWLKAYLSERPNGEFAAPAMGRLMEAEVHLGHLASARTLAKSYLDRYPKGSHGAAAHQVLDASPANAP